MDRLTAMEAFVAVAELGSFSRAAARMRMSAAMMTLHIARLEEKLGVRLFNRTTRRVDLTEDGRQLLDRARAALHAFSQAENALKPGGGLTGRVRIDAPASIGHGFIVPALESFHRLYPDIVVELSLGDRGTVFRADGFDILLRVGEAPLSGWITVPLGTTRLVCLAAPDYIDRYGAPATPEDLNEHRCILYASVEGAGGNPWSFAQNGRRVRIRPPAAFTFNDGAAIMATTCAGLGIAQNLEMLAHDELHSGRLRPLLEDWTTMSLQVVLMSARDRYTLPHVRATMDFLAERIDWRL
ncbi:LysR family transcriptional regulator [Rhizorhabdus dicambivorans]|uniref:LysR family transcriptional regulator n=1 Tax=Rhizorhabdus dicambivorans TaxID=1850238 RepID=A0A2A4FT48_9SPHN|nr:LysR family transcriptional regulator [Rhizorhabdus dicambivorans]ATE67165.1 LysR family transcriptional regulator [Rhizorhabdus dicambivorans]PCE41583.1 LysR family transcriptional regulator [Rhizorhabdus dicambivorans]